MKKFVRKARIEEDAPVNNAGSGNIAGLGVGAAGEPGISPIVQKKIQRKNRGEADARGAYMGMWRRKTPLQTEETGVRSFVVEKGKFAGNDTFIVPSDVFHKARMEKKKGKHWTSYIGEGEHADAIRKHARSNRGKPIILQDERTGALCYAAYGNKQSLNEAPLLDFIGKKQKFNPETGKSMKDPGEKIAKVDKDHDLHFIDYGDEGGTYVVRNRKTGINHLSIHGSHNKAKSFSIDTTDSTGQGPKAHKVYRKILQSGHAKALVGSSHSPGGQKIWQKLSSEKGVSVHGWSKGKPVNIDPRDPDETHVSTKEAEQGHLGKKDPEGTRIYNMKLVASLHKRKTVK